MINDLLGYEKCPSFLQLRAHHDIPKNDRFDAIQQFFRFKGRAFFVTWTFNKTSLNVSAICNVSNDSQKLDSFLLWRQIKNNEVKMFEMD